MPKTVRAKFRCTTKTAESVSLEPVYSGSEENEQFFKYTPGGKIEMTILNEVALERFEVDKEYYVDFSPAE